MALTAARLRKRALRRSSLEAQLAKLDEGVQLKRCLGAFDLLLLGLGGVVGSGVFVITGVAANQHAGYAAAV